MIGAGTFINPLLKVVTTVAILAAAYFFILKPILDTTENTVNRAFDATQPALRQAEDIAEMEGVPKFEAPADVNADQAERILRCVRRAGGDVQKLQGCATL